MSESCVRGSKTPFEQAGGNKSLGDVKDDISNFVCFEVYQLVSRFSIRVTNKNTWDLSLIHI